MLLLDILPVGGGGAERKVLAKHDSLQHLARQLKHEGSLRFVAGAVNPQRESHAHDLEREGV